MDEKGIKATELSQKSGVPYQSVKKYLKGRTAAPRGNTLDRLADALDMDAAYLKVGLQPGPPIGNDSIPIRGEVAAGQWLEVGIAQTMKGWLPFNPLPNFSTDAVYGLDVKGDSIDLVAKEGETLVCVDLGVTGISLKDGDLAIVERRRDQGGLREITAKRVKRVDGELWLIPESSNPMWQVQRFRLEDDDGDMEIHAVARVDYIIRKP